jgi:hypothetical protein
MNIGILKEKKFALLILSIMIFICIILTLLFVHSAESKMVICFMLLIIYVIFILGYLSQLQWYILDENSVTVKNIYGTVNKVLYSDVMVVIVKKTPVHTSDNGILCLFFDDGRKEKGLFIGCNVDNHKKYMVRIPYTKEVEEYLKTNNLNVNKS